jgi:DNA adenine methylase
MKSLSKKAKPFLKWAGGKTQLIEQIKNNLPEIVFKEKFTYIEPFVGSGAVLFWLLSEFPNMKKAVINDINKELIDTYEVIAQNPHDLISILEILQNEYHELEGNQEDKKQYYYEKRNLFNLRNKGKIEQSALFIFLNRTCFNGLYRVNRKNEFNVPIGSYKKPTICDRENIMAVSDALQKVEIICGDFEQTVEHAGENTLFYFDPPYKPLNQTSSFNSYTKNEFDDKEQIRLRDFCDELAKKGYQWILSNSDVKGKDENNHFFDELYADFHIERVLAKRNINANPEKRGVLSELLITNYNQFKKYERAI